MIQASPPTRLVALNYSLAGPLFVLSNARYKVDDLAWTTLTEKFQDELLDQLEADDRTLLVYRMCREEGDWIRWQNREPEVFDLIKRIESRTSRLHLTRVTDTRQTEFVLVRKRRAGDSP